MAINTKDEFLQAPDNPTANVPNPDFIGKEIISSATLQSAGSVVDLPELEQDTETDFGGIVNDVIVAPTPETPPIDPFEEIRKELKDPTPPVDPSIDFLEGGSEFEKAGIAEKETATDVATAARVAEEANFSAINAQLLGIISASKAEELRQRESLSRRGGTFAEFGAAQRELSSQTAIKALPIQALALVSQAKIQALQGNEAAAQTILTRATDKLNTAFILRSQHEDRLFAFNNALRERVYEVADREQQRILDANEKKETREYNEKKDLRNLAQQYSIIALEVGESEIASALTNPDITAGEMQDLISRIQIAQESGGGIGGQISSTTQAIIDNPNLFNSLTPTVKGEVISQLQRGGYDTSNLGTRALSDVAIKEINQTNFALSSLADLKVQIQNNLQFIGPLRGLAKLNPWSKARQIQSTIDRVRQTVGKALEGGVLRKEDEEKYKKILATITDTPETAAFKIDNLIISINGNIADYKALQESAGRSLDVKSSLKVIGAESSGTTAGGNNYTITKE